MDKELNKLIYLLIDSINDEDFIDVAYGVVEEITGRSDSFDAIEPILKLMEFNPDVDFGQPGPLVHFVEKFYQKGYEEKLVNSLERRPTTHTLWMLNRIINGSEGSKKDYYLDILYKVLTIQNLEDEIKSFVSELIALHD